MRKLEVTQELILKQFSASYTDYLWSSLPLLEFKSRLSYSEFITSCTCSVKYKTF